MNSVLFPALYAASASYIRASLPLAIDTDASRVGQTSCTITGMVPSSRVFSVTPFASHFVSPPRQLGTRGSLAVAKLRPLPPSLNEIVYRRATLLYDQNTLSSVVCPWRFT